MVAPHVTLYIGFRYVRPYCVTDCCSHCAGPAVKPKQEEPSHVEKEDTSPVQKAKSEPVTSLSRPAIYFPQGPPRFCVFTCFTMCRIFLDISWLQLDFRWFPVYLCDLCQATFATAYRATISKRSRQWSSSFSFMYILTFMFTVICIFTFLSFNFSLVLKPIPCHCCCCCC